jgi:hypothetical protein
MTAVAWAALGLRAWFDQNRVLCGQGVGQALPGRRDRRAALCQRQGHRRALAGGGRRVLATLPAQNQGQESFVRELLERSGFHKVPVIGESAASHREVQRLLFVAEPVNAGQDTFKKLKKLELA